MPTHRRKSLSGAADWTTQEQYNQGILLLVDRAKTTDIVLRSRVADALQRIVNAAMVGGVLQTPTNAGKQFADFLTVGEYDNNDKMSEEAANALALASGVTRDALESGILLAKQGVVAPAGPPATVPMAVPPYNPPVQQPSYPPLAQIPTIYVPPAPPQPVVEAAPAAPAVDPAKGGVPWWIWAGAVAGAVWLLMPKSDALSDAEDEEDEDTDEEEDADEDGNEDSEDETAEDDEADEADEEADDETDAAQDESTDDEEEDG